MYVKKKNNRNGERLVYNYPQNLVIQNDVVWTEIYVMKVCSFLFFFFVVCYIVVSVTKEKIYIRSFIVIYIITDGPRSIRYRSPVVRSWKDGSPGWSGVPTGSGSSYQKRPRGHKWRTCISPGGALSGLTFGRQPGGWGPYITFGHPLDAPRTTLEPSLGVWPNDAHCRSGPTSRSPPSWEPKSLTRMGNTPFASTTDRSRTGRCWRFPPPSTK